MRYVSSKYKLIDEELAVELAYWEAKNDSSVIWPQLQPMNFLLGKYLVNCQVNLLWC